MTAGERRVASRARIGTRGWVLDRLLLSLFVALIAGGTAGLMLWVPSLLVGGVG
jgi:hypothetical protein